MEKAKKIALWVLTSFVLLLGLVAMPSFGGIILVVASAVIAPIDKWQTLLSRYVKGKIKGLIITVLIIFGLVFGFTTTEDIDDNSQSDISDITEDDVTDNITDDSTVGTDDTTADDILTDNSQSVENGGIVEDTVADNTEDSATDTNSNSIIPVHIHSFSNATCTVPKTCSECGATDGAALGHSWNDATCTNAKTCSSCGITDGTATGHNWSSATCTRAKYCIVCSATEGDPSGHNYSGGYCSECGGSDPNYTVKEPEQDTSSSPDSDGDSVSGETNDYVLNTNSKKFHHPYCNSVSKIKPANKENFTGSRDELLSNGYSPCGNCHP